VALADGLLEQARFLARREAGRGRPRQASLRRAVSTAYYAVFHLLAADAALQACSVSPPGLRDRVQRALTHETMRQAANSFQASNLPIDLASLLNHPIPASLISTARSFARLQEERHKADYDVTYQFDRTGVQSLVREAEQLFADWAAIRNSDDAHLFLASLMFWKQWAK
jgi:hypothetical protein